MATAAVLSIPAVEQGSGASLYNPSPRTSTGAIESELLDVLGYIQFLIVKYPWIKDLVEGRKADIPKPTWKGYMGYHEAYEKKWEGVKANGG